MTTWLTAAGVILAALSHLSVSRHAPPPGWGWVYASYELVVPLALLVALSVPGLREVAIGVAATVSATVGGASVVMAGFVRPALLEQGERARLHAPREEALRLLSSERDRLEARLRRDQHPPEA